jgi:hemerythrin-like domain-containing protein
MRVTHLILGEHAVLMTAFQYLEQAAADRELAPLFEMTRLVEALMRHHAVNEDELLFDAMPLQAGGVEDALIAMRKEHESLREYFAQIYESERIADARARLTRLLEYCRDHFALEERVMIPLAEATLGEARLNDLGAEWARRRQIAKATL